jgi:RNA ligase (TIGR02306 family)
MSELKIEAVTLDEVLPHPNADKLDLLRFGSYTVCEPRGKYTAGDIVAHFPPDMLIPNTIAKQLGVEPYLKEAVYPGDAYKSKCRVSAIRLRGCPSFGFVVPTRWASVQGDDLTTRFKGVKFEPPESVWYKAEQQEKGDPRFHIYTDIENYRNSKYRDSFQEGELIRITEKIHGTNSRVGIIDDEIMCGSHKTAKRETDTSIYWSPTRDNPNLVDMLHCIAEGGKVAIAFGEIFGSKIQCMDYGIVGFSGYRLFDISVNGIYLSWDEIIYYTTRFCVPTVPLLYKGPYSKEVVEQYVDGPTTIVEENKINSTFKGREGIVITPLVERFSPQLGGRLILKAVSCDYLQTRKSDSH